jgi:hypothetical protein
MIAHMQHTIFSAKTPIENPAADVYFLKPSQIAIMPIHCWTVYVLTNIGEVNAKNMMRLLPVEALLVDYTQSPLWEHFGLQPKHILEQQVEQEWQRVCSFLKDCNISIAVISRDDMSDIDSIDNALDTLLGISHRFLQIANDFQRTLELARPLRINNELRRQYDSFILLAHRVQALSPGAFTQQFLEVYNEDDTFFLYDPVHEQRVLDEQLLIETYTRHARAGRHNLAHALRLASERRILPAKRPPNRY